MNNDNANNQLNNYNNDNSYTPINYADDDDEEEDEEEEEKKRKPNKRRKKQDVDENFSPLIRKLIEIRAILKSVNHHSLHLPSIVVIGSQSSGKSSVLEAIVGREFLPKGTNMVTRRPIELTLVHSPELNEEYGVISQVGKTKFHDFEDIKKHLTKLNMEVSSSDCVSDDPIELKIYSPSVPDLTLIDLPGYIQIHTKDQPRDLRSKISDLCHKYISKNNIILAVSPADVDLANSEALLASRRVDPKGSRTIGVITKMDLVDPVLGAAILENRDYPLKLGYIGVVCKQPPKTGLSSIISSKNSDYFSNYGIFATRKLRVGVPTLRTTLINVLEEKMSKNIERLYEQVLVELEEVRYQYKVEYNDRLITAESYVADSLDILKHRFKNFANSFGKQQIKDQIQSVMEQKVLDVCARVYWSDPLLINMNRESIKDSHWVAKLDRAASLLTKSGVGKLSTQMVVDTLMRNMDLISRDEPFIHHDDMRRKIIQFSNAIVKSKYKSTVDQVENTIKPYKYEVDCNQQEWDESRTKTISLLKSEILMCDSSLAKIKQTVGSSKLKEAINYINAKEDKKEYDDAANEFEEAVQPHFNPKLLEKANEAIWLRNRRLALKFRLAMTKSRTCRSSSNKIICPEIYLQMVGSKLTSTAVMFIQVELLNEVFFQFPREVDTHLLYYDLTKEQIQQFANQNPKVSRQLQLKDARASLELAASKLSYMLENFEEL
ncbi:hypothetical protein K502DRAFT_287278 [Neoconidiobolus thromboides FSU 785]|nr:hypothetical protein K502DRAFT_287278 [Neoconidiobolus thromboides FSU 785]